MTKTEVIKNLIILACLGENAPENWRAYCGDLRAVSNVPQWSMKDKSDKVHSVISKLDIEQADYDTILSSVTGPDENGQLSIPEENLQALVAKTTLTVKDNELSKYSLTMLEGFTLKVVPAPKAPSAPANASKAPANAPAKGGTTTQKAPAAPVAEAESTGNVEQLKAELEELQGLKWKSSVVKARITELEGLIAAAAEAATPKAEEEMKILTFCDLHGLTEERGFFEMLAEKAGENAGAAQILEILNDLVEIESPATA